MPYRPLQDYHTEPQQSFYITTMMVICVWIALCYLIEYAWLRTALAPFLLATIVLQGIHLGKYSADAVPLAEPELSPTAVRTALVLLISVLVPGALYVTHNELDVGNGLLIAGIGLFGALTGYAHGQLPGMNAANPLPGTMAIEKRYVGELSDGG